MRQTMRLAATLCIGQVSQIVFTLREARLAKDGDAKLLRD